MPSGFNPNLPYNPGPQVPQGPVVGGQLPQVYTNPNLSQIVATPVTPTAPADGVKINTGTKQLVLTPHYIALSMAAGAEVEIELGQVVDIIALGGIAVDKIDLLVPRLYEADINCFCRTITSPRFLPMLPAGKYKLTNLDTGTQSPRLCIWAWEEY